MEAKIKLPVKNNILMGLVCVMLLKKWKVIVNNQGLSQNKKVVINCKSTNYDYLFLLYFKNDVTYFTL